MTRIMVKMVIKIKEEKKAVMMLKIVKIMTIYQTHKGIKNKDKLLSF